MKTLYKAVSVGLLAAALSSSCKRENDMYAFDGAIYTISVDMPAIVDIPANNPGEAVLVVTTDAPYWIVQTPDWITPGAVTCPGSETGSILSLAIESNYKSMSTTTNPRSGVIKISGGRTSISVPVNQLGHEGWVDPSTVLGGIHNESEFMDFVTAVNDGEDPVKWMNDAGEVELLADLDLTGLEEWVPIGYVEKSGNANNMTEPRGEMFKGIFNGGGHTVRGFRANVSLSNNASWGFFGYIDGATVKNLNFEGVDITLAATGIADAGVVVGTMRASRVENVRVSGRITSSGTSLSQRFAIGGIAGYVFSVYDEDSGRSAESCIKDCETNLFVNMDCGANLSNGAAGAMYGGIAAFCTGVKDKPARNRIENCVNKGSMTMNVGRSAGIVATANYGTVISGCTNSAAHLNTFEGDGDNGGRISQICCIMNQDCAMTDCANSGDLTTTFSNTTAGALTALLNHDTAYIEGGSRAANTGTIICAHSSRRGLLCAGFGHFDHVSNVLLSGKLGRYRSDGNHSFYAVTEGNIMQYIGYVPPEYASRITNITYISTGDLPDQGGVEGGIDDLSPTDDTWD